MKEDLGWDKNKIKGWWGKRETVNKIFIEQKATVMGRGEGLQGSKWFRNVQHHTTIKTIHAIGMEGYKFDTLQNYKITQGLFRHQILSPLHAIYPRLSSASLQENYNGNPCEQKSKTQRYKPPQTSKTKVTSAFSFPPALAEVSSFQLSSA